MAVLIESITVVINDEVLLKNPSKRDLFLKNIPSNAFCTDGLIYGVSFMEPDYVKRYIDFLESEVGLTFLDRQNNAKDIVVIDMLTGPTSNCDWIGFKRDKFFAGREEYSKSQEDFSIAWRLDRFEGDQSNILYNSETHKAVIFYSENGIFFPHGWTPDKAIYASDFTANPEDELEEMNRNENMITYKNKETGEIMYAGIPNFKDIKENTSESRSIGEKKNSRRRNQYLIMIGNEEGNPKNFLFEGNESYTTVQYTEEEFHQFAIKVLSDEYKQRGVEITNINTSTDNSIFNFIANLGDKETGFIIRVDKDGLGEYSKEDYSEIIISSKKLGVTPRLAIAKFWIWELRGEWAPARIGENTFRNTINQSYRIGIEYISLLHQQQTILPVLLSHNNLLLTFAKAWESLDVSIIEPYLDNDFHYLSDWVFDELPSKVEYLEYITGKFINLKKSNRKINFDIVQDSQGELMLLFNEDNEKAIFYIETQAGRILFAHMSKHPENPNNDLKIDTKVSETLTKDKKWWKPLLDFLFGGKILLFF